VAKYKRGQVVWAKAEKSAEGGFKERPVVIIAGWPCAGSFDYLAMICSTSKIVDPFKFKFSNDDFKSDGFPEGDDEGWIRPSYLTVVQESDVIEEVGFLSDAALEKAIAVIRGLVR
jgi:hypothetical protein